MEILNEQEAAAVILYSAIEMDGELTEFETGKISNTIVFCSKFKGADFKRLVAKFFYLKTIHNHVDLIKISIPLIQEDFKKTLYARICDLLCSDGNTSDLDINLMSLIASYMGIPNEESVPIATSFMQRYAWNYHVA